MAHPLAAGGPVDLPVEWVEPAGAEDPGGGGPDAIVLLHEGLGTLADWRRRAFDIMAALATSLGRPVMAFDRLGHGHAPPLARPRDPGYLRQEGLVTGAVLDVLGISRPALIGHSDGGSIALLVAAARPVHAVVSIAAHVLVEQAAVDGITDARRSYIDGLPDPEAAARLRAGMARRHGDKADALFGAWADTWLSTAFRAWSITDALPSVTAPVLVMQGGEDAYATADHVDAVADPIAGPTRRLIIPGLGHAPHIERPDRVLPAITEFLEDAAAGRL